MTTFTSPVPSNSDETAVKLSPLGLAVEVTPSQFPDIVTYTVPAAAGYDTGLNPFIVMGGVGRLFFVNNQQTDPLKVITPTVGDVGVIIPAGTSQLVAIGADGASVSSSIVKMEVTGVKTAVYDAAPNEVVLADPSSIGTFQVRLPLATPANKGQMIWVKNVTLESDEAVVVTSVGGFIDGLAFQNLQGSLNSAAFVSDGNSNWWSFPPTPPYETVTDVRTVTPSNAAIGEFVRLDPTAGAMVLQLPAAAEGSALGGKRKIVVKNQSASANNITITPAGADTVDGAANLVVGAARSCTVLVSDGVSDWMVESTFP